MKPLLVRVDANSRIGLGHAMRCLALAQAWQATGGRAVFLMAESTPGLEQRLTAEGNEVRAMPAAVGGEHDASFVGDIYRGLDAELLAVDGYQFDAAYQQRLKAHGVRLLVFDDYGHASHYAADFVLNQTNAAEERLYPHRAPYSRLLLGTRFVLLRREFWPWIGSQREHVAQARRILVTLGGADPDNATATILAGLSSMADRELEVTVVLGAANSHVAQVTKQFRTLGLRGQVLTNVEQMPPWMHWADLAITAGGSTVWELALFELPCAAVILAENQQSCLELLHARQALVNLGWQQDLSSGQVAATVGPLLEDLPRRKRLGARLHEYIDGRGVERLLHSVCGLRFSLHAARSVA